MSGVQWVDIQLGASGCSSVSEVEELLRSAGVEKNNVFSIIKTSVGAYGRDRAYREGRNKGLKAYRDEITALQKQLAAKK